MSQEFLLFTVTTSDKATEQVSKLKEVLQGSGIMVKLEPTKDDPNRSHFTFNFDTDRVKQIKSRGAGRKEVYTPTPVTCAEVAEMRKTMTEAEILKELEISRSTYYRRLKRLDGHFSDIQYF